jgi:hypothetical protein
MVHFNDFNAVKIVMLCLSYPHAFVLETCAARSVNHGFGGIVGHGNKRIVEAYADFAYFVGGNATLFHHKSRHIAA